MTKSKGGLGRGLEALIPNFAPAEETPVVEKPKKKSAQRKKTTNRTSPKKANRSSIEDMSSNMATEEILYCPVSSIRPNPDQPRRHFDEETLAELSASIKENGILSPLLVVAMDEGYMLVSGERRLRAAKLAGLDQVPVLVRDMDDRDRARLALVENVQRSDLSAYEEAQAYEHLMRAYGYSAADLADRVGKSRPYVANLVRLLQLPQEVLTLLAAGEISAGHARVLLRLEDAGLQRDLAKDAADSGLSVRALEAVVADLLSTDWPEVETNVSEHITEVQAHTRSHNRWQPVAMQLSEKLQTNVRITGSGKRGRLTLEFYGEEDLMRLFDVLGIELR